MFYTQSIEKTLSDLDCTTEGLSEVLRDSKRIQLLSEDVTVGDLIFFESGIKVPADIRLVDVNDLSVNESLLTGESVDVIKDAAYISSDIDEPIGDRKNMLYAGSMITKGRARWVVTASYIRNLDLAK